MAVERGVVTPQELPSRGRTFLVADGPEYPCYRDHSGLWWCGHLHDDELPLEDLYQYRLGWTAQAR